jgi:hypothetical protein
MDKIERYMVKRLPGLLEYNPLGGGGRESGLSCSQSTEILCKLAELPKSCMPEEQKENKEE